MTEHARTPRIFNVTGDVKFSVKPGHDSPALTAGELASLSDYFQQSGIIASLSELATFSENNKIIIPEITIKAGTIEIVVHSRIANASLEPHKPLPWYKRPLGSFFRTKK